MEIRTWSRRILRFLKAYGKGPYSDDKTMLVYLDCLIATAHIEVTIYKGRITGICEWWNVESEEIIKNHKIRETGILVGKNVFINQIVIRPDIQAVNPNIMTYFIKEIFRKNPEIEELYWLNKNQQIQKDVIREKKIWQSKATESLQQV